MTEKEKVWEKSFLFLVLIYLVIDIEDFFFFNFLHEVKGTHLLRGMSGEKTPDYESVEDWKLPLKK